jgi:hypothetical protein
VRYVAVPSNVVKNTMLQMGFSEWQADGLIELNDLYKRGAAAQVTDTVRVVARTEPRSFAQFVYDFAGAFAAEQKVSTAAAV